MIEEIASLKGISNALVQHKLVSKYVSESIIKSCVIEQNFVLLVKELTVSEYSRKKNKRYEVTEVSTEIRITTSVPLIRDCTTQIDVQVKLSTAIPELIEYAVSEHNIDWVYVNKVKSGEPKFMSKDEILSEYGITVEDLDYITTKHSYASVDTPKKEKSPRKSTKTKPRTLTDMGM